MNADIEDIKQELWLRMRDSGELRWETKDGSIIPIKDLSISHLKNICKCYEEKEKFYDAVEAYYNANDY